jgi:hypothetical protein
MPTQRRHSLGPCYGQNRPLWRLLHVSRAAIWLAPNAAGVLWNLRDSCFSAALDGASSSSALSG